MIMICGANSECSYFKMQKFFTISLVFFYSPFLHRKFAENRIRACEIPDFKAKKGGNKLVEGVKNFFIF